MAVSDLITDLLDLLDAQIEAQTVQGVFDSDRIKLLNMRSMLRANLSSGGGTGGGGVGSTDMTSTNTRIGATNSGAAATDLADAGINALLKRLLSAKLPNEVASQQTLANLYDRIPADLATQAGVTEVSGKLNGLATQATLAQVLAKITQNAATEAKQTDLLNRLPAALVNGLFPVGMTPALLLPTVIALTIPANAALSDTLDLGGRTLLCVQVPAAWTAAGISFEGSVDNLTFGPVYSQGAEVTLPAAATRVHTLDPTIFLGARFLRVRSGTAATPIVQTAARELKLGLKEF